MSDYTAVQKALAEGGAPAMLCTTCPWDRTCVTPPAITKAEVDAELRKAQAQDREHAEKVQRQGTAMTGLEGVAGTLMTAMMFAGRDLSAQVCPVFALRLRSGRGREIADGLKASMQGWDDSR